MNFENDVNLH